MRKIKVTDEQIIQCANESMTASEASSKLGIKYSTYKKHAERLNVFVKNQGGKGTNKLKSDGLGKIPLNEILEGKHPSYQTNKLRIRLIKEKIKEEKCEICGLTEWKGNKISFDLDHIDGNCYNHKLENLRMICPNCHSQTHTYRGKNKSKIPL